MCRKLTIVGTAASVPALAGLLGDKDHSHMARYALERIPAPEAGQALREALARLSGNLKIGVISSLGLRRDAAAVSALGELAARQRSGHRPGGRPGAGRDRHCRRGDGAAERSTNLGRRQAGRDRRAIGLCRSAAGRDKHGRGPGHLQVAGRRQPGDWCVWPPRAACWPAPGQDGLNDIFAVHSVVITRYIVWEMAHGASSVGRVVWFRVRCSWPGNDGIAGR